MLNMYLLGLTGRILFRSPCVLPTSRILGFSCGRKTKLALGLTLELFFFRRFGTSSLFCGLGPSRETDDAHFATGDRDLPFLARSKFLERLDKSDRAAFLCS